MGNFNHKGGVRTSCYAILGLILFISIPGFSHPVSLNWVEIGIEDSILIVRYKILAEDLVYFHRPGHDEYYDYDINILDSLADVHGRLILQNFRISDENGILLDHSIDYVNSTLNGEKVNIMDLMRYEIQYRLEYKMITQDWKKLIIQQTLGTGDIKIPVVTFLSVYNGENTLLENVEVQRDEIMTIYPSGNNPRVNPSKLTSSFFTISESGIRHELTIPVKVFYSLLGVSGSSQITPERINSYFLKRNHIYGNEQKLKPQLSYFKTLENSRNTGFMYMDLFYPSQTYPGEVRVTWTDYNWHFRWFDSRISANDSTFLHTFSRFQPYLQWESSIDVEKKN